MKPRLLLSLALASLPLAAACKEVLSPAADYDPSAVGTVDNALCRLGFTGVPLRGLVTGHHLVDVVLNGRPGTFVLDTGANATVLHTPRAARFGVEPSRIGTGGAIGLGGNLKASQASIESLSIGPVAIRASRIMVADLSQLTDLLGKLSGREIDGIVGSDVMAEHRAVIDVAKPFLYLQAEDRAPAPVPAAACTR